MRGLAARSLLLVALLAPATLLAQKPTSKPAPTLTPSVAPQVSPTPAPSQPRSATAAAPAADFARVDAYADAAPGSAEQSVAALAAYLAQAGPDELSRTRALFRWVAGHIAYDAQGFRSGSFGDVSPDGVLRSRSSVCEGYARLSEALGTAMGLQIQVVSGWSKGYGYTLGERLEGRTNHAWNAVRVNGQWYLMDPTWGAGHLDRSMQFVRRFQEHYFLTAPDAFIYDHLPEDPRWQLLERTITAGEYAELAHVNPTFFQLGFRLRSHPNVVIPADDRVTVTLGVTRPVQVTAQLLEADGRREVEGHWVLVQVGESEAQIATAFPRPGEYVLRLFAKPRGASGSLTSMVDYRVRATRGAGDAQFPQAFSNFGARANRLFEPLSGLLAAGQTVRFRLRVPDALDVAVTTGGHWFHLTQNGDEFTGEVAAVAGDITVWAKYDPTSNFTGLLRYTGR